jgi:HEAT repeat protein
MWILCSFDDEAIDAVLKIKPLLKDRNKTIRFTAAMVLFEIQQAIDKDLQAVLVEALKEDWEGLRPDAFERLTQMGEMDLSLALVTLKSHNKELVDVGMAAISLLGLYGELGPEAKEAVPMLVEKLSDAESSQEAALALSYMGTAAEPAVPILVKALKGNDEGLILRVPDVLGRLGPVAKAAVPALIEEVKNGNDDAASALGRIGADARPAVPTLQAAAKAGSVSAAGALWDITRQKDQVLPVLLTALKDGRTADGELFEIISRMGPEAKEMVPDLLALLKKNESEEASVSLGLSQAVIIALGEIGPSAQAAIPLLKKKIKKYDRDEYAYRRFQLRVAYSVWQIDHEDKKVFALLRAALKTSNIESAIEIIGKIGPAAKEFAPDLLAFAKEMSDAMVNRDIIGALEKVDPEAAAKLKKEQKGKPRKREEP